MEKTLRDLSCPVPTATSIKTSTKKPIGHARITVAHFEVQDRFLNESRKTKNQQSVICFGSSNNILQIFAIAER